jgi:hypothetical protein
MKDIFKRKSKGQIVLVVLLASAVLMTLGLSASKKAVTDTKIDTDEELLKQAFNTAESGVDYYLATGSTAYSAPDGKSVAQVDVIPVGGGTTLSSDGLVLANNTFLFWLIDHDTNGNVSTSGYDGDKLDICVGNSFSKALKIDFFYKNGGSYSVTRLGYNFNGDVAQTVQGFTIKSGAGGCIPEVAMSGQPLLIAATPIGGSTSLTLRDRSTTGVHNFPLQGEEITSLGRTGDITNSSGVNSQVKVMNRYKVPAFMLDAITAGNSVLSK